MVANSVIGDGCQLGGLSQDMGCHVMHSGTSWQGLYECKLNGCTPRHADWTHALCIGAHCVRVAFNAQCKPHTGEGVCCLGLLHVIPRRRGIALTAPWDSSALLCMSFLIQEWDCQKAQCVSQTAGYQSQPLGVPHDYSHPHLP